MDVVEVAPPLDVGDRTCTLAAHLLFEWLALLPPRLQVSNGLLSAAAG